MVKDVRVWLEILSEIKFKFDLFNHSNEFKLVWNDSSFPRVLSFTSGPNPSLGVAYIVADSLCFWFNKIALCPYCVKREKKNLGSDF